MRKNLTQKKNTLLKQLLIFVLIVGTILPSFPTSPLLADESTTSSTFTNPIVPVSSDAGSADPSIVYKDGYYYYVKSDKDASLIVAKAKRLQDIGTAPRVTVYTPPSGTKYSKGIWAPELQYINGKWYIYFAADDGNNINHRMYVLESDSQDPQGTYTFKGQITDPTDVWAIDGMAFQKEDGSLYFVWSGWRNGADGFPQRTYIAPMSNPWTISGDRVEISSPTEPWEGDIQEGQEVIIKDGTISIIYSANGSWSDDYVLGQLTNTDGDVLNPDSWTKHPEPIFKKNPAGNAYGTGHHGFTKSPDGTEDWMVYHAFKNSGGGWGDRSVRAQEFTWNEDGTPNFGEAAAYGEAIPEPSGTPNVDRVTYEAEDATLGGDAFAHGSDRASGEQVVGKLDREDSDFALFDVEVPTAGLYTLIVMAANGTGGGAVARHKVVVNDSQETYIDYRNYGWEHYNPSSVDVELDKGSNTIKLTKKTNFAEIDQIILHPVEEVGTAVAVEEIKLGKENISLKAGNATEVNVSIKPIVGTDKNLTIVVEDNEIATVSEINRDSATGSVTLQITGVSPGETDIEVASADENVVKNIHVNVQGDPGEPDLTEFTVDHFEEASLASDWSIFQESRDDWSLTQNPGAMTIHTTATDIYQDNNSQNNVFLQNVAAGEDFEIVTKLTAPIAQNHQQAGLFVWENADNLVKLAHVWDNGPTVETAYEVDQVYRKPGNFTAHPGGNTITMKIKKSGNQYTSYFWDGYNWIQAADPLTAELENINVGFFANSIVASDRIDASFDYFAYKKVEGGVEIEPEELSLEVSDTKQLENSGPTKQVNWVSSNPSIATVSDTGLIEGIKAGRTKIIVEAQNGNFRDEVLVTITSDEELPAILFEENFDDNNADGWSTYDGTWTVNDGKYMVESGPGHKTVLDDPQFTDYVMEADVELTSGREAGLIFRASDLSVGADALEGYFFGINAETNSAILGEFVNGQWNEIASRNLLIEYDQAYQLKVVVNKGHIQAFINDNPLNENPYPKFDLVRDSHLATGKIGFRTWLADASFDNVKITSITDTIEGPTYTNSVMPDIADPYVLYHEGTYYLYGTHTPDFPNMPNGIKVYTSTDLVNWTEQEDWALYKDDTWGDNRFWAPEVIEKDGTFYMYYAVEERLAVATSDSPLGPFVQEEMEPIHPDTPEIDAHIFTDDDGKQYMYFVRFEGGNVIYVAELNEDMKSIKEDTLTFVMRASQDWENSQKQPVAPINEGAFVIKHKDTYYLTYSANHFESPDYGVGYATAPSPMGPWTKYEYNPIMKSNIVVPGAGHHSLIHSPDGKELFMVYHTHNSTTETEPRKLAIDRVQFVPQENGPDVMEVWGPTVTPQPMPSSDVLVESITVSSESGQTKINTKNGTLQLLADVLPTDATDPSVTWSIESGASYASVSDSGLVTAHADGTVVVKAMSVSNPEVSGSITIDISKQTIDVSELDALIESAQAISNDNDVYTPSSFQSLQDAIAEAQAAVIETQSDLDVAVKALQAAIDGLVEVKVDPLDEAIGNLTKGGTLEVNLETEDGKSVLELNAAQVKLLKDKGAVIHLIKDGLDLRIPVINFTGDEAVRIMIERYEDIAEALTPVYDFTIIQGEKLIHEFISPVTMTFQVSESKVTNAEEVKVYYYDNANEEWVSIGGSYKDGYVTAETDHFTVFTVLELLEDDTPPTDGQEEEPSPDENDNDDPSNGGKDDQDPAAEDTDDDNELPDTASNMFNLLFVGMLLVFSGLVAFVIVRRRSINM
ncbi:family 43 glycosylhydrolase [Radiobacillus sp. PE A8.2]|uniref:family 43 glycosylhydrolase n=1 Tax=Radiobacillus sp. PE A8.2 TaxID=3380349 RepID=UPI003890A66F